MELVHSVCFITVIAEYEIMVKWCCTNDKTLSQLINGIRTVLQNKCCGQDSGVLKPSQRLDNCDKACVSERTAFTN